jgi:hypothetical protein
MFILAVCLIRDIVGFRNVFVIRDVMVGFVRAIRTFRLIVVIVIRHTL